VRPSIRINFTDFWHGNSATAIRDNPLFALLSKRFDLELTDDPDFLLYSCFGAEFSRYRCTRIFYTGENKRPNFAQCDYAFSFDFPVTERNFRMPLYALYRTAPLCLPKDADQLLAAKTGFCSFVYSNARAQERIQFMEKLSRYKKVDSGGKLLNNIGYRVADKVEFMRAYKFSIAFENSSWPGYTTEKLPEALVANTVPIYWGSPLVERDFNPAAFVNCHSFRSLDDVVDFVVELDKNDALYKRYLGAPGFTDNRPNEFIDEEKILDRFATIFSTPLKQPVATTVRGVLDRIRLTPKVFRQRRRAQLAAHTTNSK